MADYLAFRADYVLTITAQDPLILGTNLGESHVIKDLQMEFKVVKDLNGISNELDITVYNLPETVRNFISKDTNIKLEVGYKGQHNYKGKLGVSFVGQVITSMTVFQASDIKTVIKAGDGYTKQKLAYTARNFKGASIETIATTLLKEDYKLPDVKVIQGTVAGINHLAKTEATRSLVGYTKDELDKLAEANFFDWFVRDGVGYILPLTAVINESNQVVKSGIDLINLPSPFEDKANKRDADPAPYKGYKFKTLMNPNINLGNVVELVLEGKESYLLKVGKVEYSGSFEGSTWETVVTGYLVEGLTRRSTLGSPLRTDTGGIA